MIQDLIIPVEKQTTVTEQVGVTLKELTLLAATPATPGVLVVVLAAKDADGEWRNDLHPITMRKEDDLNSDDVQEQSAASVLQALIFSAIVNENNPQVAPLIQAYGLEDMTVWDAAKVILANEMQSGQ